VLRDRLGRLDGRAIVSSYARITAASALAAGAAFGAWYGIDAAVGRSLGGQILSVGLGVVAGTGVFFAAAALLRVRELRTLLSLRRRSDTTD
jgi:hypothetical protein